MTMFSLQDMLINEVDGLVGPVNAGQSARLRCSVQVGAPSPSVLWFRNNVLLDSSYEQREKDLVVNDMILHEVGEEDALDSFSCKANNNNVTRPTGN